MEAKKDKRKTMGSALILTIVLTSLLAIVGALFIIGSRVDRIASSSITDSRDMNLAVETILARLSQELVEDVPGVAGQEYYDYPDHKDEWLASLEPDVNENNGEYMWRQTSKIPKLGKSNFDNSNVLIETYVPEYPTINLDAQGDLIDIDPLTSEVLSLADADGDGVPDAKWIELDSVSSSKGKPVYAAIRIIDNAGMLNVNTGYEFDSTEMEDRSKIDGKTQTQINLATVVKGTDKIEDLDSARNPGGKSLFNYENEVVWPLKDPNGSFIPFNISDELDLRNRYILDAWRTTPRLESEDVWEDTLVYQEPSIYRNRYVPIDTAEDLQDWKEILYEEAQSGATSGNFDGYNIRHLLTTNNMDRIIDPQGNKMKNVDIYFSTDYKGEPEPELTAQKFYDDLLDQYENAGISLDSERRRDLAQIIANIKDYSDIDTSVTMVKDSSGTEHFGFERPCAYISEVSTHFAIKEDIPPGGPGGGTVFNRSYGIEIYKLFGKEEFIGSSLILVIEEGSDIVAQVPITSDLFAARGGKFAVILFDDAASSLIDFVEYSDPPPDGATGVDPDIVLSWPPTGYLGETKYDVYFGTDRDTVKNANRDNPGTVLKLEGTTDLEYDPPGTLPLTTWHYWRIDDANDTPGLDGILSTGPVMSFETWAGDPDDVADRERDSEDPNLFNQGTGTIALLRYAKGATNSFGLDDYLIVDLIGGLPSFLFGYSALNEPSTPRTFQRDISTHRLIRDLWDEDAKLTQSGQLTLGNSKNNYHHSGPIEPLQAWPRPFHNIGEIGNVFRRNAYGITGEDIAENEVRINLADPYMHRLFQNLTVMDPYNSFAVDDKDETRVKGRININTAPWYVLAQLPWVSDREKGTAYTNNYSLAKAIEDYRDMKNDYTNRSISGEDIELDFASGIREEKGFASIGELNLLIEGGVDESIRYYEIEDKPIDETGDFGMDQRGFPDISTGSRTRLDGAGDDFEERNLLFYRMSDLVTVRSDMFTAYILVRIGTDGPQKRYIAVLDRSKVKNASDTVKILALHSVPDPR
jgi:predicted DNA-binding ArsR family transcriptional regulator